MTPATDQDDPPRKAKKPRFLICNVKKPNKFHLCSLIKDSVCFRSLLSSSIHRQYQQGSHTRPPDHVLAQQGSHTRPPNQVLAKKVPNTRQSDHISTRQGLHPRKPDHILAHQGSHPTSHINHGSSLPCLNHLLSQPLNTALTHFKTAHSIAIGEHSSTIRQMKTQLAEIITAADPPSFLRKFQKSLDVSVKK